MLDSIKYIKVEVEKYRVKQNSDGTWICIDLKANTIKELDTSIGQVNQVLNRYNKNEDATKKQKKKPLSLASSPPSNNKKGGVRIE